VSNLERRSNWLQAPFWCWTSAQPQRRAVFVRQANGRQMVSDLHSFERPLPIGDGHWEAAVAELGRWEAEGLKLRSRALITTLFARLCVADLFIHGIGGAKYDEVTDAICTRYFDVTPPAYATISGTLRLPIAGPAGRDFDVRAIRQTLRELDYRPEKFLKTGSDRVVQAALGESSQLIAEKHRWVALPKTTANAAIRHQAIQAANRALQPYVASQRRRLETELTLASDLQRAGRVLGSREYAFCLFSPAQLQHFLLDFGPTAL
jgi:hypothetical protein